MGLFDIFKSDEQKEREKYLLEIQQSIFPRGKAQIEKEIKEIRSIFNFKYTYQEIYDTYVHATTMHYISKDKSKPTLVTSILHNSKSYLTKEDAEKLSDYVIKHKSGKSILNNLADIRDNMNHSDRLSMVVKGGLIPLKKFRIIPDSGKFEVLIFNTIIALTHYKRNHPNNNREVEDDVIFSLFKQAKVYNVDYESEELHDFITSRLSFYTIELNRIGNAPLQYLPAKIFSNFYESPLSKEPKVTENVMDSMIFYKHLHEMIKWVTEHSNKI